jgi:hypothetical protein
MTAVPPHLSERIQRRIDEIQPGGLKDWLPRVCKERLNALPLNANQIYVWALRADGAVLCMDHESASLSFEEEDDPRTRFAVLTEAARLHPELAELVPPRPEGVEACDACGGTGATGPHASCSICGGLRWRMRRRPVEEWMERIERGDRLHLRVQGGSSVLVAGRLAGMYAAVGDGLAFWCSPADDRSRRRLSESLKGYAPQRHAADTWQPNHTGAADPFDSTEHALRFSGVGTGGSYATEIGRLPDGRYRMLDILENDFDSLGGAFETVETTEMDAESARRVVEGQMRRAGSWDPFPAIVARRGEMA